MLDRQTDSSGYRVAPQLKIVLIIIKIIKIFLKHEIITAKGDKISQKLLMLMKNMIEDAKLCKQSSPSIQVLCQGWRKGLWSFLALMHENMLQLLLNAPLG